MQNRKPQKKRYNSCQLLIASLIPSYKNQFVKNQTIQKKLSSNNSLKFNNYKKTNKKVNKNCCSLDLCLQNSIKEEEFESSGRPLTLSASCKDIMIQEVDKLLEQSKATVYTMLQQSNTTTATNDSQKENLNQYQSIQKTSDKVPFFEQQRIATFSGINMAIVDSDSEDK